MRHKTRACVVTGMLLHLAAAGCAGGPVAGGDGWSSVDSARGDAGAGRDIELDVLGTAEGGEVDAPRRSVLGTWELSLFGAVSADHYKYTLSGTETSGSIAISHLRNDLNGVWADCTLFETATGSWAIMEGRLDVIVLSGTTERTTTRFATLDCRSDEVYAQRAMTDEELLGVDLADGPYGFNGDRLMTTARGDAELTWDPQ